MKVFVVWFIPDYSGIDIIGIFSNSEAAQACLDNWLIDNKTYYFSDDYGIDEYDVEDCYHGSNN